MTIADPLRNPRYQQGQLLQECAACQRRFGGHNSELVNCPLCGATTFGRRLALEFGGLLLVYDGTRFRLHPSFDSSFALIDEADIADSLRFLCLHDKDYRQPPERIGTSAPQLVTADHPMARHVRTVWEW